MYGNNFRTVPKDTPYQPTISSNDAIRIVEARVQSELEDATRDLRSAYGAPTLSIYFPNESDRAYLIWYLWLYDVVTHHGYNYYVDAIDSTTRYIDVSSPIIEHKPPYN
jgi:hypothetical protein